MDLCSASGSNSTKKKGPQSSQNISLSARKRRRKATIRKYKQTQVALSESYKAWKDLKDSSDWTHGELAAHLLDVHRRHCTQTNCKPFTDIKEPVVNASVSGENNGKKYAKILPKPAGNQNDMSKSGNDASSVTENMTETVDKHDHDEKECNPNDVSEAESDAASSSVHTVVGCEDETISKDHAQPHEQAQEAKGREEDEDLGKSQGEVELKEPTAVEDFLTLGENLEPDEMDLNDEIVSDNEELENDVDVGAEPSIEVIFDSDEDGYSSEEGEGLKEKRQRLDDEVTDLPFKRFDLAEVAKAEGVSDVGISRNSGSQSFFEG
ncbi:hypothetical protein HOLleu_33474 [Holothuria leucospilota]|uniref:Uncharacterized protein n=1 Tax=Holothuria leucospilota TaxID=206669 RepID=A0A9Q0YTM6_HOLLE|nr:hypothetical protein HOLleu_33474 [Holothuria leucospilota]